MYEPDSSEELDILVGNIKKLNASIENLDAMRREERTKLSIWLGDREAVLCPTQGKKVRQRAQEWRFDLGRQGARR